MAYRPAAVLSILVNAHTGGASASLTKLDRRLRTTAGTAEVAQARIAKASKYAGIGIAAGLAGSVAAAATFEQSFSEVRKTVDTNERGFGRLERGIRGLAQRIPTSASALAELAGEAGALGIKSKAIVGFTKVAAQLGVTTNLSSEAAANSLARLANIMDTKGRRAFSRMGATLVDLGNKGASTEDEIAAMSLRIAGAAKTLGMSESATLGLAASLSNVGIAAEMGGSAISRVMLTMQDAIARGGEELENFARTAGMTTDEFTEQFERSAPAAIAAFASGLGKANKEGKSTMQILDGVSLGERRVGDTLLRIAGNTEQFTTAQGIANKAWRQNTALTDEARKRYDTFISQVKMLGNSIIDTGIGIGQQLLPDLKSMIRILRNPRLELDEKIARLGDRIGQMIEKWAPKALAAGAKVGVAIVKGLVDAWWQSPLLAKLFAAGALIRLVGGAGALSAAGGALATPIMGGLAAGIRMLSMTTIGTAVGIKMLALAPIAAKALSVAIPGAFAALGIGDTIAKAIRGDTHGAAFQAGGAIAGAVAGGLAGGLPGALIGAGIGTLAGNLIGKLFDGGNKLASMQERLRASSRAMGRAFEAQRSAAKVMSQSSRRIEDARHKDRRATRAVHRAEERLQAARRNAGPNSKGVQDAEARLALAKDRSRRASQRLRRAEKLSGVERNAYRVVTKNAVKEAKIHISTLKTEREQILRRVRRAVTGSQEEVDANKDLLRNSEDLAGARKKLNRIVGDAAAKIGPKWARSLKQLSTRQLELGRSAKSTAGEIVDPLGANIQKTSRYLDRSKDVSKGTAKAWRQNMRAMGGNFSLFSGTVYDGMATTERNFQGMGSALGQKPPGWSLQKPRKQRKQRGGVLERFALGGVPHMDVPGVGSGDKVHLEALVEPGEKVFVLNRVASGVLDRLQALNSKFGRHGASARAAAEGIGALPRRAAGGIVALGHQLQRQGYEVGENPHFGGVAPVHAPNSYHYRGMAIDVNDDVPPFASGSGEPGSLQRLYNRLKGLAGVVELLWQVPGHYDHLHVAMANGASANLAGLGGQISKLPRVLLEGPDSTAKQLGQAVLDRTRKRADSWLRRHALVAGPHAGIAGGIPRGPGKVVGASTFGGPADPGTGTVGYRGDSLPGTSSYAELGMGTLLGGLPYLKPLRISANGRSVVAQKRDIGAGGAPVQGHPTAIDLWWETARKLGLGNAWKGLVKVQGLQRGGRVLQRLRDGGLVDLPGAIRQMLGAEDKGRSKRIGKRLRQRIERLASRGINTRDEGSRLTGRLKRLRDLADQHGDWADRAAQLADTGGTGRFHGLDESGWLHKQLEALLKLRNGLVRTERKILRRRRQIERLVRRATRRRHTYERLLKRGERHMKAKGKAPDGWKHADPNKDVARWNRMGSKSRKDLAAKFLREGGRLAGDRAFLSSGKVATPRSHPEEFPVVGRRRVVGMLKEAITQGKAGRRALTQGLGTVREELSTVQGPGIDHRIRRKLPPFGVLGGEIFDSQRRLQDIAGGSGSIIDDEATETLRGLLREANQRLAVSERQFEVFRATPVLGAFATGGIAAKAGTYLVGEEGPEPVHLPRGARVEPNSALRELGGDTTVQVLIHGDVISDRGDPVELVINDRRFPVAVQRVTRGQSGRGGRPLPGRAGGMNG